MSHQLEVERRLKEVRIYCTSSETPQTAARGLESSTLLLPYLHGSDGGENDEPEPHDDEDLLVEEVLRQEALVVRFGDRSIGAVVPESALGDAGEGRDEGVQLGFRGEQLKKAREMKKMRLATAREGNEEEKRNKGIGK